MQLVGLAVDEAGTAVDEAVTLRGNGGLLGVLAHFNERLLECFTELGDDRILSLFWWRLGRRQPMQWVPNMWYARR